METDIIILGILSGGDFFGYELMKIIKSVMSDIANVTTGTLYYKLKNHEKKGHLRSVREREGLRPQRRRYSITPAGRKTFRELALNILTSEKRPYWPYLSSVLFVQHLPSTRVSAALRRRREDLAATRGRLVRTKAFMESAGYPFHTLMLVDHGLRHLDVDMAWIAEFTDRLESLTPEERIAPFSPEDWKTHLELTTAGDLP